MESIFIGSLPSTLFHVQTSLWGLGHRIPLRNGIRPRTANLLMQPKYFLQDAGVSADNEKRTQIRHDIPKVTEIAVTMTIVSFALPQPAAFAKVAEKKRTKTGKKLEVMLPEEREAWTRGLPFVHDRIPYTDILRLKAEGKLKHIIKHPKSSPKARPDVILVVLDDDRVVRTVLPVPERDEKFWDAWDKLELDTAIVNAYTPPLPKPEPQRPLLGFLGHIISSVKAKDGKGKSKPESSKMQELQRARMEMQRERKARQAELKFQKDLKARAIKEHKKLEERQQREEEKRQQQQKSIQEAKNDPFQSPYFWYELSTNEGVRFFLGIFFFWLFYYTVVLSYKKRQKDYEDRLKIEKAEEEERKKMKQWEESMEIADAIYSSGSMGPGAESEKGKKVLEEAEKNPDVKLGLQFLRSGARVRRAKGRSPPRYLDKGEDVKFSDVAGLGDIRMELEEIVEFFRYGEKYRRRGARIPGGILLCGEPGTGKTLLAKAVAGEAGVNFFSISASQFVEIYVGVGASRVRALYQEARENAPAVVFIDELDAVGRQRGLIKGSGGQERDATLNQLLTCLDGFEGRGEVITIAATNRPDILDSALVRPGRFDRKIYIPKPGLIGRIEILKVHARKKPMADDIDYNAIGTVTEGMVGAQLANLLDIAALKMIRDGRSEITTDDLLEAAQLEESGLHDKRERSMELWRKLALNEASMAVVAVNFPDLKDIQLVNIAPRSGEEKGGTRIRMDHTKFEVPTISRQAMLDHITVQLAPRAADEIWHGSDQLCTIWADTVDNARSAARELVFAGLSDKKEMYGLYDCWYEVNRLNEVDVEALRILNMCYERAKKILQRNQKLMDALMDKLIEKKTLRKQEFLELVENYGHIDPMPPQPIEIRNARLAEFREKMMAEKRVLR
eukprot:Gb_28961 [translate_table: standard]